MSRPAWLLVFALAACKGETKAPPAVDSAVAVVPAAPSVMASTAPPPPVKPPPSRPALSAKVGADGEARRASAAAKLEKSFGAIEEVANAPPAGCNGAVPACRKRFEVFALELGRLRAEVTRATLPHCPKSTADDLAIEQMVQAQVAWLSSWIDAVETVGRAGLVDPGKVWDELRAAADKTHPRVVAPCAN